MAAVRSDHWFALVSLLWATLVATTAFAETRLAVWLTAGLIWVNFSLTWRVFVQQKRILVVLNAAQMILFGLIHYQIYRAYGPHHYTCDVTPDFLSWVQFTAAHVLRAADVLDFLEEYGIDLQNVRHASTLSGCLLVALHLLVGVFLLAVVLRGVVRLLRRWAESRSGPEETAGQRADPIRKKAAAERLHRLIRRSQAVALILCLAIVVACAVTQHWGGWDWILWPLDNALRTLDLGDAMQIFGWRLHGVPTGWGVIALAITFRFLVGLYLAELISYWSLVWLRERALRTLDDYVRDLSHPDPNVRRLSAESLGKTGPAAKEAVPALIGGLNDPDPAVRKAAAEALGNIGPTASDAVPELVRRLDDVEVPVSGAARWSLSQIDPNWMGGPAAQEAIPGLTQRLTHPEPRVAAAAANALAALGSAGRQAVPALIQSLGDKEGFVSQAIVWTLKEIDSEWANHPALQERVSTLITRLGEPGGANRQLVVQALAALGPAAERAVPALIQRLDDRDLFVRRTAPSALAMIDPHWAKHPAVVEMVRVLIERLDAPDGTVRQLAVEAIEVIGPAAKDAVPALIRRLEDKDVLIPPSAARALGKIGPAAAAAVPALVKRLDSCDETFCLDTVVALREIGPTSSATMALRRCGNSPDKRVREAAAEILAKIDPNG